MIGDSVPVRFSQRIKGQSIFLPVRVPPKKKIRKSPIKKRTSSVNSSLLKVKKKTKLGEKNKFGESPTQASKVSKQASHNLKPSTHKSSQIGISKIHGKERKAKKFLKTSQINLTNNQFALKNPKSFDNSKKVLQKKYHKKTDNEKTQSVRRSLRLSKSSPSPKEKNEISDTISPPKRLSQKKCTMQVTTLSSELVLTPNLEKWTHKSKLSGGKKAAKFSTGQTQEKSTPTNKTLTVTSVPLKVTCTSRHSGKQKSGRLSKEPCGLSIMKSEISLNTSSFHSLLETPLSQKHSEKRKSTRLLEPSPFKTLNINLPLSTSASLLASNSGYVLNKSSKSCKRVKHLSSKSSSQKSNSRVFNKDGLSVSHEKQKWQVKQHQKTSENSKKPLSNKSQNLPLDVFATPSFVPPQGRSLSKKCLSKSDSKSSKRKLNASASEKQVANETSQDAKKRKSAGDNVCVDNSTSLSKYRSMKKSVCPVRTNYSEKVTNTKNFEGYLMPVMNILGQVDVLTADLFEEKSQRRVRSMPFENEIDFLTFGVGKGKYIDSFEKQFKKQIKSMSCGNEINCLPSGGRKGKSTGNLKRRLAKRLVPYVISPKENSALSTHTSTEKTIEKKTISVKSNLTKKHNIYETPQVSSHPFKVDCLTADLSEVNCRRTKLDDRGFLCEGGTYPFSRKRQIKTLAPIKFIPNMNLNTESSLTNSKLGTPLHLPIDDLTTIENASRSQNVDRLNVYVLSPCYRSKTKTHSWPLGNKLCSEISAKDGFPKIPSKGTLKYKRWLLNNLKEKSGSYEDDLFENQKLDLYTPAFHLGDESDGSSINIATPKFDCILTPALPKKTPRFKDCISPTEFLQARKTAEEYLFRRNKKRKSGEKTSSEKKTSVNKTQTAQEIPEKKKLDFEEAVNKLIAVQKNLEIEAEVDEEEDVYFSDA